MTLLSHYTSRDGLAGIAQSKCIRATKFSQLNDKREIEYGYIEFIRRALLAVFEELDKLMPRRPGVTLDLADGERRLVEQFRQSFEGENASEPLYVASFAKGKTEDHVNRGMLTLWDRYTKLEGYCLQFREEEVRRIIDLEASRRNYAILRLDSVHYGMDEGTSEYCELAFQMKQHLLIQVLGGMPNLPIKPAYQEMWPFGIFATRMLQYIAKHKDPFFEDERETRVIAAPGKNAQVRFGTGIAMVKHPKDHADGRRYIGIGEEWRPGLEPGRIIIGPKADKDIDDVLALFQHRPIVIRAKFPV